MTFKNINSLRKSFLRVLPFAFIAVLPLVANAQFIEVGGGFSMFNYKGELAPMYRVANFRPGGTLFTRLNYGPDKAIRIAASAGQLAANGFNTGLPFNKVGLNSGEFTTRLLEASIVGEYNFLDYRTPKKNVMNPAKGTPFLYGGIAAFNVATTQFEGKALSPVGLAIPLGIGYKYALDRRWNLILDLCFRKTFMGNIDAHADKLEERQYNEQTQQFENRPRPQRGFRVLNDWYMSASISLSYTLYSIPCPVYLETPPPVKGSRD